MKNFKEFANSFQAKSKLRLEGISRLCEKAGNPQDSLKFIHVAGTNGKGSVCAFLQCILTDAGYKCGKYISPNMIDVCERISIDGEDISKKDMDSLLEKFEKAANEIKEETGEMVTQFEIWTGAAFTYFADKKCDIVVLETGLGGRLDATNVIKKPIASVITKIGTDHIEYLGNSISEIATEKAGIIKKDAPLITINQNEDAMGSLLKKAEEENAPVTIVDGVKNQHHKDLREIFDYKHLKELEISLAGFHQTENASLAIETALMLNVDEKHIRSGLLRAKNMGRFEQIEKNVIFDGAHNEDGAHSLVKNLRRYFESKSFSFVYGAMADKDLTLIMKVFEENGFKENSQFYTVTVEDNPRADTAENLAKKIENFGFKATPCENILAALNRAKKTSDIAVICGSLYLYKDLKSCLV